MVKISWKTLFFNGSFGGFSHYFWFNTHFTHKKAAQTSSPTRSQHQKLMFGPIPNGPRSVSCDRAFFDTQVVSGSVKSGSDRWRFLGYHDFWFNIHMDRPPLIGFVGFQVCNDVVRNDHHEPEGSSKWQARYSLPKIEENTNNYCKNTTTPI